MSALSEARRFLTLPWQKQGLFLTALLVLLVIRAGLYIASFKQVRSVAVLLASRQLSHRRTPGIQSADGIAWAVVSAARFIPGASCLAQALAAEVLLARDGHAAQIHLGVAKNQGAIQAHAWVECSGRVLLGDLDLDRYAPLQPSLTSSARGQR
jgi:hypothetical protein